MSHLQNLHIFVCLFVCFFAFYKMVTAIPKYYFLERLIRTFRLAKFDTLCSIFVKINYVIVFSLTGMCSSGNNARGV